MSESLDSDENFVKLMVYVPKEYMDKIFNKIIIHGQTSSVDTKVSDIHPITPKNKDGGENNKKRGRGSDNTKSNSSSELLTTPKNKDAKQIKKIRVETPRPKNNEDSDKQISKVQKEINKIMKEHEFKTRCNDCTVCEDCGEYDQLVIPYYDCEKCKKCGNCDTFDEARLLQFQKFPDELVNKKKPNYMYTYWKYPDEYKEDSCYFLGEIENYNTSTKHFFVRYLADGDLRYYTVKEIVHWLELHPEKKSNNDHHNNSKF